jgi:hypothetical protein
MLLSRGRLLRGVTLVGTFIVISGSAFVIFVTCLFFWNRRVEALEMSA